MGIFRIAPLGFVQEYLARLQAIRQQNYQERKRIQQRYNNQDRRGGALEPPPLQLDQEERKRKIAALKVRFAV